MHRPCKHPVPSHSGAAVAPGVGQLVFYDGGVDVQHRVGDGAAHAHVQVAVLCAVEDDGVAIAIGALEARAAGGAPGRLELLDLTLVRDAQLLVAVLVVALVLQLVNQL